MDPRSKVYEILKGFSTAMLVTSAPGKQLESRPMQIAKAEENGAIWFFTGRDGRLASEIGATPAVLVVFQDDRSAYLSVRGEARIVQDGARVRELWKEPYKVWFPGGVEDPNLALIEVDPVSAEYWDNRGLNKLEYMYEAAKAYVKGQTPDVGGADMHGKTAL